MTPKWVSWYQVDWINIQAIHLFAKFAKGIINNVLLETF